MQRLPTDLDMKKPLAMGMRGCRAGFLRGYIRRATRCIRFRVAQRIFSLPWLCITSGIHQAESGQFPIISDAFSGGRIFTQFGERLRCVAE